MATMTLDELVTQLRSAYGTHLSAVVLYGSAAAGERIAARSNYNVLVLVETLSTDRLQAAAPTTQAWIKAGNPAPLTLTVREWRASADIFRTRPRNRSRLPLASWTSASTRLPGEPCRSGSPGTVHRSMAH